MIQSRKGFTLLELLIVIGILAILATAAIVVLNPAELLRQARDTQRISDISTLNSALSLYVTSVSTPVLGSKCGNDANANFYTNYSLGVTKMSSSSETAATSGSSSRAITGSGWLPVDFSQIAGGSPLSTLPADPSGTSAYNYQYMCYSTTSTYELDANMESTKFAWGGSNDKESTDGGDHNDFYEVGTYPALSL